MSEQFPDKASKRPTAPAAFEPLVIQRPTPCALASKHTPDVALFLTLNCPRCGQLAALDALPEAQFCLAECRNDCHFTLAGEYFEFMQ